MKIVGFLTHESRVFGHESLFSGHESLFFGHESLFSGHESLFFGHESLISGHKSLFFGHESRVFVRFSRNVLGCEGFLKKATLFQYTLFLALCPVAKPHDFFACLNGMTRQRIDTVGAII